MTDPKRLSVCLLLLRIGVAIVMLVWSVDKFVRPEHTAGVFAKFYMIPGLESGVAYALGAMQLLLVIAFALGVLKTVTYGAVLALHTVSTLSSFQQYLNPFEGGNILFFAAWPMLSACVVLFLLRDSDSLALSRN